MGVCALTKKESSRKIRKAEVGLILECVTQESQVNESYMTLIGQTQTVFENLLNNKVISRNIGQAEYDFYSKQTEELSLLNTYLQNYYNNYYRIVVSNIKKSKSQIHNPTLSGYENNQKQRKGLVELVDILFIGKINYKQIQRLSQGGLGRKDNTILKLYTPFNEVEHKVNEDGGDDSSRKRNIANL
ncbi:unnamed protein product (macronuclear) [Paramecium tetraurelia]|uniref:Uncharacterized protein n=1 Tax=Paramecium tetraurelia TaxID=5888 RepID=A0DAR2_PARTE|nr:uncharacterized protein GSPATT00015036001 [Paramecium tetraurelia]CAK80129.1 unnamed protein product [Paramecium tetraurelia]|eukprot:XP_001447526.1 hypothetical protein (macronuclear) [Paramecium tetraurelia strain d4-2]